MCWSMFSLLPFSHFNLNARPFHLCPLPPTHQIIDLSIYMSSGLQHAWRHGCYKGPTWLYGCMNKRFWHLTSQVYIAFSHSHLPLIWAGAQRDNRNSTYYISTHSFCLWLYYCTACSSTKSCQLTLMTGKWNRGQGWRRCTWDIELPNQYGAWIYLVTWSRTTNFPCSLQYSVLHRLIMQSTFLIHEH